MLSHRAHCWVGRLVARRSLRNFSQNPNSEDAKKARDYILGRHPTWKIPERRVQKFLKKQQVQNQNDRDEPDDYSVSSVTRRVKGMVKKILVFHKPTTTTTTTWPQPPLVNGGGTAASSSSSPTTAEEPTTMDEAQQPPIKEIHAASLSMLLPPADFEDTSVGDDDLLSPSSACAREMESDNVVKVADDNQPVLKVGDEKENGIPMDEVMVYKDDNDGTKDRCCAPCEGCTVM